MNNAELEAIADGMAPKAWNDLNKETPEKATRAIELCNLAAAHITKAVDRLQNAAAIAEGTEVEPKLLSIVDALDDLESEIRNRVKEMEKNA